MTGLPSWRKAALYSRALVDEDGLVTGREVCVLKWEGQGVVCEGALGAQSFDHAYFYELPSHAVRAAEDWTGQGPPPGDWTDYKASRNGDFMPGEGPVGIAEQMGVMRKLFGDTEESFQDFGKAVKGAGAPLGKQVMKTKRLMEVLDRQAKSHEFPLGDDVLPWDENYNDEYRYDYGKMKPVRKRAGEGNETLDIKKNDQIATVQEFPNGEMEIQITRFEMAGAIELRITWKATIAGKWSLEGIGPGSRLKVYDKVIQE